MESGSSRDTLSAVLRNLFIQMVVFAVMLSQGMLSVHPASHADDGVVACAGHGCSHSVPHTHRDEGRCDRSPGEQESRDDEPERENDGDCTMCKTASMARVIEAHEVPAVRAGFSAFVPECVVEALAQREPVLRLARGPPILA